MAKKKVGKYVVDLNTILGQGSFATVYLGVDTQTTTNVAVKVLDKAKINQDEYTKNAFQQQYKIMVKLKSANVIGFLALNQTKSNYYLIMELANQGSLRTILKKQKDNKRTLAQNITTGYLIQLLNGFGQLFKFGIIHRDIKPQNIFVKDGVLKIGDFGFAKKNSKLSALMSTIVGSYFYMAPQILDQEKYTYKCDIWSLGVMTYEMLTGKLPFQFSSQNLKSMYNIILKTKIHFPQFISQNMQDFIAGCLRIKQQERFDWPKVFLHPIFKGIFQNNFKGMKKGEETLAYIMSSFRMIFQQYNVNIQEEIKKLKKPMLSRKQFQNFLIYLNCDITKIQVDTLSDLLSKSDKINLDDFNELLNKYECKFKIIEDKNSKNSQKMKFSLAKNLIKSKLLDLKPSTFKNLLIETTNKKSSLNEKDFQKAMLSIIPQLPLYIVSQMFAEMFSIKGNGEVQVEKVDAVMQKLCEEDCHNEETKI